MADNPYSDNPYQASTPTAVPYRAPRPGGVTVIGVLAIILGLLGVLGGCIGGVSIFLNPMIQNAVAPGPNANPVEKAQAEMNAQISAIGERYIVPNVILMLVWFVLAGALTFGGIQLLRVRPGAATLLYYTFMGLIVFELLRTVFGVFIQLQMFPVIEEFTKRIIREGPAGNPAIGQTMASVMRFSTIIGLIFGIAWPLVKIIVYGFSMRYLAKPNVAALFVPQDRPYG